MLRLRISTHPGLSEVAQPFRISYADRVDDKLDGLTTIVHRKLQEEAPERSGNLKRAIVRRKRGKMDYEITVDRRMKGGRYEHYVRLGTRAHIIAAVRKKALFWPGAAHPVKIVKHPGTKANDYWTRGIDRAEPEIRRAEELIGSDIEQHLTK